MPDYNLLSENKTDFMVITCAYDAGLLEFSGKPFSKDDALRAMICLFDYMYFMDEKTCVNGTVTFIDLSHYSLKCHAAIPLEDRKVLGETWQVNFDKLFNFNHSTIEHLQNFYHFLVKCQYIIRSVEIQS